MGLVERHDDLEQLVHWLVDDKTLPCGVVAVEGAAGTGKTALLREFGRRAAEAGAVVMTAACTTFDREVPFAVLTQLFLGPRLPKELRDDMSALLEHALTDCGDAVVAQVRNRVCRAVAELAGPLPVAIVVDDAHRIDHRSEQVLAQLVHTLGPEGAVLVLADRTGTTRERSWDFSLLRPARRLPVRPLSVHGVRELLHGSDLDAAEVHAATDGNPLLVNAFLHGADVLRDVAVGCLRDSGEVVLEIARALAVRGPAESPEDLARLVEVDIARADEVLRTLVAVGICDEQHRFRHPAVHEGVLGDLTDERRRTLHLRAARQLYTQGAPAISVARHLTLGPPVGEQWAAEVLLDAAGVAMADDRPGHAAEYLRSALRVPVGDELDARLRARLAFAEWLVNPSAVARHLPDLCSAARAGRLDHRELLQVLRGALWLGRQDTARELLPLITGREARPLLDAGPSTEDLLTWLGSTYPVLAQEFTHRDGSATPNHTILAAQLSGALLRGDDEFVRTHAGSLLSQSVGKPGSLCSVETTLLATMSLLYAGSVTEANEWCDELIAEGVPSNTPTWQAVLHALHAEASCRRGDLPAAVRHGEQALEALHPRGWGVAIGLPLGALVLAHTRMGQHGEASKLLTLALPDAMFDSRYGLHYLHARGHHQLATGRSRSALADFLTCGDLMVKWSLDLPGLVPWRTSAAEAYLRHGNADGARAMVLDQLAVRGNGQTRSRAVALRHLATLNPPGERLKLLTESADLLEHNHDQLELALALRDLGRFHQSTGDRKRARTMTHRAWQLAHRCGATPLCQELLPDLAAADDTPAVERPAGVAAALTRSELRVASLAVMGYTNREIAGRLFITPSTVEQHLTRAFRKLNVRQRSELPLELSDHGPSR
jgi:DNA-binding CsgD family transcriptional regulator